MAADPEEEEHIPVNMLNRVDLPDNMGIMEYHKESKFVATTLTCGHMKSIDFDAFTLMIFVLQLARFKYSIFWPQDLVL